MHDVGGAVLMQLLCSPLQTGEGHGGEVVRMYLTSDACEALPVVRASQKSGIRACTRKRHLTPGPSPCGEGSTTTASRRRRDLRDVLAVLPSPHGEGPGVRCRLRVQARIPDF